MSRHAILVGFALCLSLTTANDAAAQRSGFIIGFGLGPGVTTGDVDTEIGLATEFKIGAKVGQSAQVRMNFYSGDFIDFFGSGLQGLGVTYELPSAPGFSLSGTIGTSTWLAFDDGTVEAENGFGLGGGFGYEFADLWMFNVVATWGQPVSDFNMINLLAYISILSQSLTST
jgi:hypothetical protein